MNVSTSKRQRLQQDETSESVNDSNNCNGKLYHKVICQKDYLQCICHFLSIPEIISIFYRLSQFHNNFLIDKDQLQMYYLLLSYDFGNIRAIYNIKYNHRNNKDENVCQFFAKFYWDSQRILALTPTTKTKIWPPDETKVLRIFTLMPHDNDNDNDDDSDSDSDNEFLIVYMIYFDPLMLLQKHRCIDYWLDRVKMFVMYLV